MTFPPEYFSSELAGQTVSFELTVKEVGEPVLPAIDSDFAVALGIDNGDLEQMRSEIETNLRREVKRRLQARVTQQVMDLLLSANPIEAPIRSRRHRCWSRVKSNACRSQCARTCDNAE